MHDTAAAFGAAFFRSYVDAVEQPRILEIGAGNVNGSLRGCAPSGAQYIGADLEDGPGVDLVLANPYAYPFDAESFEAIVSSSCLEHDAMFWLSFAEMCRVVRNGGFIYLNVPSNGTFHRYPTDNWRFYPDAGMALAQWGRRNGHDIRLIESFVGRRRRDIWNDCVMVFGKAQTQPPVRLLADLFPRSFNIRAGEEQQNFRNYCELTEDMSLQAWLAEKFKIVSDGGAELGDASIGGLIATLAEREAALSATQRRAAEREAATAAEIDAVRGALAAAAARAETAEAEAQEFKAAAERAEAAAASAVAKSAAEAQEFKAAAERAEAAAGAAVAAAAESAAEAQEFKAAAERAEAQAQGLRSAVEKAQARAEYAARAAKNAEARLAEEARERGEAERRAAAERALMAERAAAAEERLAAIEDELSQLRGYAEEIEGERERLRDERDAVLASSFWRLTGPARRSLAVMPPGLRRQARRGARLAYWLLTPHRTRQRIAYLRSRRGSLAALPVPLAAVEPPATEESPADSSPLMRFFDPEWYAERYGDVAGTGLTAFEHFLLYGAGELRDPNPAFDSAWYLEAYPDVAKAGMLPLEHFIERGAEEGRLPFGDFDFDFYRQQAGIAPAPNLAIYRHYLTHGRHAELPPSAAWLAAAQAEAAPKSPPSFDELKSIRFRALEPLRTYQAPHHGPRVTIVTDSINSGSLYGGVATAIVFAALLARRLGGDLRLVARTEPPVAANLGMILRTHGIPWNGNVEFLYSPPGEEGRDVPMNGEDLFVTTSWWTTRATRGGAPPDQIIYLLQEDERMFYPMGDDRLLCVETLSDPRLRYVVNSSLLFEHLKSEGLAPGGVAFEPAFPSVAYYAETRSGEDYRRQFFFYARPNNLRNLYWRGVSAIAAAIEEDVFDPEKWDFCFIGKDAHELILPRGVRPRVIQNLPWSEYAAFVRRIDVGLSLMYAPHPSYPPFDLAASGAVVVTNRCGQKRDLSHYSPNILCVEPSVPALVAALREAVALAENPTLRAANAARFAMPRDWATTFTPVLNQIAARRTES